MGLEKDLPPGEQLLALFRPFLEYLAASDLSPKTIQKHVDNMWVLGGEFIRDLNDDGLAAGAIDAAHGVEQENQKSPERDELEMALGKLIVAGGGLVTAGADGGRTPPWTHRNLNTLVVGGETGLVVDESPKSVATV